MIGIRNNKTFFSMGYTDDANGYSGAFSWWKSEAMRLVYVVCNHTGFGKTTYHAVIDDFGNLVEVKS